MPSPLVPPGHPSFAWASLALALTSALTPLNARATTPPRGVNFHHHDWELVCDNTRTCRAAGYHAESDEGQPVSVLLTRKAGPGEPVSGQVTLGAHDDRDALGHLPPRFVLALRIDGHEAGTVMVEKSTQVANLSRAQISALLAALPRRAEIRFVARGVSWRLSGHGATAVLLKMDEAQGRLGTPGALVRKGSRSETEALPALPAPTVTRPPPPTAKPGDDRFVARHGHALHRALLAAGASDGCDRFPDAGEATPHLEAERLSATQMLVAAPCWLAAYNAGDAYWVVNDSPPFKPVLVTDSGTSHAQGVIEASHKGRGLGDCRSEESWAWDGTRFVLTRASTSGMCRLVTPGGAWDLPSFVSNAEPPQR